MQRELNPELFSFTPCIFPMIPITLAILGHDSQNRSRAQNFLLTVFYVIGIATTYSLLGLLAASSGALFGASLGNPWVLGVLCALMLMMALSMYGAFELQVPAFLRQGLSRKTKPHYIGAYLSGIVAGVVASPCVGPVLVSLLAFVASSQNQVLGFFLLFTYALGLGLIFLLLGAFTELVRRLPRSGPWMDGMKFVLGSLMLGAFYYYLSLLIPARWFDAALGLGLVVVASFFGAFIDVGHQKKFRRIQKGLMQALLVVGIGFMVTASLDINPTGAFTGPVATQTKNSQWPAYSEDLITQAKNEGRPVIIDFFAEWCLACHELDEKTFTHPDVQSALKDYVVLRFDATKESAELSRLRQKYKIRGLPTVVFLDTKGNWLEAKTLTEFEKPDAFLKRLKPL